ncbi:MAG: alpha/beta fold hydrolase [Rhodospirillaceae bacterium]|nr:alpha/beta fold hydrolase [Rhodospirillaceae bacterium]
MRLDRRTLLSGVSSVIVTTASAPAFAAASAPVVTRQYAPNRFGQLHLHVAQPKDRKDITRTPLVCFHQTPASGHTFDGLIPYMATDRVLMAVDTPGYGESDRPPYPVTIGTYADGVADALQALGYGKGKRQIDVLAYHTGCLIAADMAARYPQLVRRLVLTAVPYYPDPEKRAQSFAKIERWTFSEEPKRVLEFWDNNVKKRAEGISLELGIAQFQDRIRPGDKEWWGYEAVFSYDPTPTFAAIKQPMAILNPHGALKQQTEAVATAVPGATFVDLPEITHSVFQLNAGTIATHARAFLDR